MREPRHTCPDIDKMISLLEDLRDANSSLREWGEYQEKRADELEKRADELEKRADELEKDLEIANDKINDLLTN